jgi:hypothetical protein
MKKGGLIRLALLPTAFRAISLKIEAQGPLDLSFAENRVSSGGVCAERGDRYKGRSHYVESGIVD